MTLPITSLYAAILALLLLALTYYVIKARVVADVSVLHGDNMDLATKIRRHGNFVEFVPMTLILMALAELGGARGTVVHPAGAILVVARILQPFGMDAKNAAKPLRIIGGMGTHVSILICVGAIFYQHLNT